MSLNGAGYWKQGVAQIGWDLGDDVDAQEIGIIVDSDGDSLAHLVEIRDNEFGSVDMLQEALGGVIADLAIGKIKVLPHKPKSTAFFGEGTSDPAKAEKLREAAKAKADKEKKKLNRDEQRKKDKADRKRKRKREHDARERKRRQDTGAHA